jgi:hypothetical protein
MGGHRQGEKKDGIGNELLGTMNAEESDAGGRGIEKAARKKEKGKGKKFFFSAGVS